MSSLKERMAGQKTANTKAAVRESLYKNERAYRLDRRVDAWAKIPEIGVGLKNMDEATARNVACNLDNQAAHMSKMNENQMAAGFNGFTPENMLRLVRLAMPNVVRNKLFTEFAMETARDSIKYVRPVYSKTFNGNELVDKTEDWNRLYEDDAEDERNNINTNKYRRPLYESTEDRISQELAEVLPEYTAASPATAGTPAVLEGLTFNFAQIDDAKAAALIAVITGVEPAAVDSAKAHEYTKASKKWGANGEKFLNGYTVVYYNNDEQNVIAIQDKATNKYMISSSYSDFLAIDAEKSPSGVYQLFVTVKKPAKKPAGFDVKKINAFARYNSEDDYEGDFLGEVEIKMSDYEFRPRPTSIGVSWNQMSEVVLDTSFGISTEETLVTYASQAIRMHLDYQAVKMAYRIAKINPEAYHVTFNAAFGAETKLEGYIHNAQTFPQALETVGDVMLNDINRGGVSKIVCGPSAGTYLTLVNGFVSKGNYSKQGIHQFGTLNGLEAYKAPSSVIKTNDILTIFKNPENESDVSIAFGTLVPFFSTGTIQRKNFFKEVGLSTLGDWHCINRRYLALITIEGLKDDALTTN